MSLCVFVYVCVCLYLHVGADALGGQKRATNPLELELQAVMSCLTWVLGAEPVSSGRAQAHFSTEPLSTSRPCFV